MSIFLAEFIGTAILVILGDGVVANVVLGKTKGNNSGWIVITAGWAFAVTVAVYCVNAISGAHLNPAVTLALTVNDPTKYVPLLPQYLGAQFLGGIIGGIIVWIAYYPHWSVTPDAEAKRAVFCTAPAIRYPIFNLTTEIIGTFMLVLGIFAITGPANMVPGHGWDKAFAPFLVGILVWSIGLSLGGPTGYAINPARDLGPRIAHFILPIPGKTHSDWGYAWIPVVGPIIGGILGALLFAAQWPKVG
ncbi:MAG TPA: MIP/aquaporin family protein [Gemmatales bacterium]|nr:MIP/aquaporin family protein [Gemmatales bacterium]